MCKVVPSLGRGPPTIFKIPVGLARGSTPPYAMARIQADEFGWWASFHSAHPALCRWLNFLISSLLAWT
jgi:hypothetical protein